MKKDYRKQVIVRMPDDLNRTIKANYQKWGYNNINEFICHAIDKSINSHFNSIATTNEYLIDDFSSSNKNLFDLAEKLTDFKKLTIDQLAKIRTYIKFQIILDGFNSIMISELLKSIPNGNILLKSKKSHIISKIEDWAVSDLDKLLFRIFDEIKDDE